jgi:aspartyl-tRNA(Asn)/glutamyl-tRNA(Gln) amidotransferase subunit A
VTAAEPWRLSAGELLDAYRARDLSPVEVVDALAERIQALDAGLGAFTTLCLDRAREEAAAAERQYAAGTPGGALAGVPFGVKDLFDSAGVRTTYGSPMFADHVPDSDAVAVRRVREAGGILIGKTQTHEFAWGITSVNELMGTSHNPWDRARISGGSSGGSAVALAARMLPLAIGSDTGGSIRVPSAFCGTVGHKPTFGRIATDGVFPLAPSLDHPGAMARTPADAALLLAAMDGPRPAGPPPGALAGVRFGISPGLHLVSPTPAVTATFEAAVAAARGAGAEIVELDFVEGGHVFPTFGVIQRAEALATHRAAGLYPQRRGEYGDDVRGRLGLAEAVGLDEYRAAIGEREQLRAAAGELLSRADLLLTLVAPDSPPKIGAEDEIRDAVMPYTTLQDLLGLPACALRAGYDELGLPIGVQLTGRAWADEQVLSAAQALFEATGSIQEGWPV